MAEECAECGEEKLLNGDKNYKQPVWAVSSFLTLCLAVGASGEKILVCTNGLSAQSLLLISCANSELNSEPQAAASFGSHQLSSSLCTKYCAAPNFSCARCTKFLFAQQHQFFSLLSSTKFSFAVQHQFSLVLSSTNFLLLVVYYFAL